MITELDCCSAPQAAVLKASGPLYAAKLHVLLCSKNLELVLCRVDVSSARKMQPVPAAQQENGRHRSVLIVPAIVLQLSCCHSCPSCSKLFLLLSSSAQEKSAGCSEAHNYMLMPTRW